MLAKYIFNIDMALGYLAWALCIATYVWPRLKAMDQVEAHRAIATFNSFRFFGLVFLLPGFVGPNLPQGFATPVAYGDLATALLAILALLTVRVRFLFWPLVWGFNLVGLADLVIDTARAVSVNLPSVAGQLGAGHDPHSLCTSAFLEGGPRVLAAAATWARTPPLVGGRANVARRD